MKLGFLFLVLAVSLCFSCRNEKKEKYLLAVEKALDREIEWVRSNVDRKIRRGQAFYDAEGRNPKFKPLIDSLEILKQKTEELFVSVLRNDSTNNIEIINNKNNLLSQLIEIDNDLQNVYGQIVGFEFIKKVGSRHVVVNLEKNLLQPGDSLKGYISMLIKPTIYHKDAYQCYVNGSLVYDNDGIVNILIPRDSTRNMKPGIYNWVGNIKANFKGRDSLFVVSESFNVESSICEN